MMDLYYTKRVSPMLIKDEVEAFDDPDYIYEVKFDGIRCIAYIDPENEEIELHNKKHMLLNIHFPELLYIYENVKERCILDGEIFIMRENRPNFADVQRRLLTSNISEIKQQAKHYPATFVAYDILYHQGENIEDLPLLQRKEKLKTVIRKEDDRLSCSRYLRGKGVRLHKKTEEQNLEGVVAKHINSKYYQDEKTKEWLKIKNMNDDDFIICGYTIKGKNRTLILGQYTNDEELVPKGQVDWISKEVFDLISTIPKQDSPFLQSESEQLIDEELQPTEEAQASEETTDTEESLVNEKELADEDSAVDEKPLVAEEPADDEKTSAAEESSIDENFLANGESSANENDLSNDEHMIWIQPKLVCKIKFTEYTDKGEMREPTFVAIRDDKLPHECIETI